MKRIYFVSDAHLGFDPPEAEQERTRLFIDFLSHVRKTGDALIIAGDLFDFWFEYQTVIPRRHFEVLVSLRECVHAGVRVDYITGNHDFWVNGFFRRELGIAVHTEPWETELEGQRFFIAHGDGLARDDRGYRFLKRVLRNPVHIGLYRMLHPAAGFALANFFSSLSRNHREIRNRDEEYAAFARSCFARGFSHVVMGHTHRPMELRENGNTYINTGDWMHNRSYGVFHDGRLELRRWKSLSETETVDHPGTP